MMFAREDAAAKQVIELRVCISTRNKNSLAFGAVLFPEHRHAMGRVLAIQTYALGNKSGANVLKPNQTNTGHCVAPVQLWGEAFRELLLHHFRVNAKVCQDAPADYTLNNGQFHGVAIVSDAYHSEINAATLEAGSRTLLAGFLRAEAKSGGGELRSQTIPSHDSALSV